MSAHEIEYIETEGDYVQMNNTVIVDGETQEDGDEHWEDKSIRLLLDMYLQNIEKFRDPKMKKKNVWLNIAHVVGKGPENCDKKFRNLKQTYVRLLKKKNRSGALTVRWPYFNIFEEIFSENGEYQPEIQQKIQEGNTEDVAKVLLSINAARPIEASVPDNEEASTSQNDEAKKKLNKKRYNEFRKITLEMRDRQRTVEEKLDRLINIVEESNAIQRERNAMFQQFLEKLNNSQ
ncbi:uncharacterized protein LOC114364715 [Ostrinia furnacalis]|uniref:uncharacterized protein LOC114364715 n=1 Tax=Ostrinia furnacalis TaxID=93504 RepID=UPI00103BFFFB|nr:uncharacterized protein LOC114364715 [Ostrinia furnacalis]